MMNSGLTQIPIRQTLEDFLVDRAQQRNVKKKHVLYSSFPDIREMQTRVYWGVFSWSIPKYKQRWLIKQNALSWGGTLSSPGDIVRDYLDYYHPARLRCIGIEARTYERSVSAPLMCTPSITREMSYIDISSTYFSIVKLFGWNVGYLPERWLTAGRAPLDFPLPEAKGPRNYLTSIGLPRPLTIWNGYKMVQERATNVHINRALWLLTSDVLHSIAAIAETLGAIYVHTDGYILPTKNAHILQNEIESWGLLSRELAQGDTYVFGIGNYKVGNKASKSFDAKRGFQPIRTLRRVNHMWLKNQCVHLVNNAVAARLYDSWPIE